jgi:hypothetical protein
MCRAGLALYTLILCAFIGMWPDGVTAADRTDGKRIRPPAVAGLFYPGDPDELRNSVRERLSQAPDVTVHAPVRAILAPHAGHRYCGETMAAAFKSIEGSRFVYDTIIMLGACHRVSTKAAAVSSADIWETPLGDVPIDVELARELTQAHERIEYNDAAHAREHSLEVQLPYVIVAAQGKPFRIVPVITNSSDPLDHALIANAITKIAAKRKTLLLVSSDLSHFPSADIAKKVDGAILEATASLKSKKLSERNRSLMSKNYTGLSCTMCGLDAVLMMLRCSDRLGIDSAKVVSYTHSGMVSGDEDRVVGYGSIVFTGASTDEAESGEADGMPEFSKESRKDLIRTAKEAVQASVSGDRTMYEPSDNPELQVKAGCFVTLKNNGRLRGCIGRFTSDKPLWDTVRQMAIASATMDKRFQHDPITPEEVPDLSVEISVLSPPKRISDPLKEIRLGTDGIIIKEGGKSGTFLPQVATETGWSPEEFLGHCARDKAGIGWDGWKKSTAEVYTFTAVIIEDH